MKTRKFYDFFLCVYFQRHFVRSSDVRQKIRQHARSSRNLMRCRILIEIHVEHITFGVVKRTGLDDGVLTSELKTNRVIDITVQSQHHLFHSSRRSKGHGTALERYLTLDLLLSTNLISLEKVSLEIERDEPALRKKVFIGK